MLDIKPSHKPIKGYYEALKTFEHHGITHETAVRNAFQDLLKYYAGKKKWDFTEEYGITLANKNKGSVDGALLDKYHTVMGYWEAKDSKDDLGKEVKIKFDKGYPQKNMLFQEPKKAILYQDGQLIDDYDLTKPEDLISCLRTFFEYKRDEQENWEQVVEDFKERIPESARRVIEMIESEKKDNKRFREAFTTFATLCRQSINPNLSDAAIEEMLVQHLLTSRIFESVFDRRDFDRRNIIAKEIESVIDALTSREFSREKFFKSLDHFYVALENRAKSIDDWSQKQHFLNAVYEKFFQGFSVKVADTHGIVYTPQPIVDFMVKSVDHILKTEFGRSLGDEGVHILDPFTGTGNFIMRVMKEIPKTKLPKKYAGELHCNEIMLLPYYIASMNIEHEYFASTGEYKPFEGICLVDTFELAEPAQVNMFSTENTERVEKQKRTPITVVIGNPPYNSKQVDENDNNKNRKYKVLDGRVSDTYAQSSNSSNKNSLSDPYVKAYRYAADRVIDNGEGMVAYVSNNSFQEEVSFDGMRKELLQDFDEIYVLDLGGNVRKNPKLSGTTHNVFGIQVGVCITLLIRKKQRASQATIHYARLDELATKKVKYNFLNNANSIASVEWEVLVPDAKGNWLTEGMSVDFDSLIALGSKEAKRSTSSDVIFQQYSLGVNTNRDSWAYNFEAAALGANMSTTIDFYNEQVFKWKKSNTKSSVDDFVVNDNSKISWSSRLKECLQRGQFAEYEPKKIRKSIYRPFTSENLYLDSILTHRPGQWREFFPNSKAEEENLVICLGIGGSKPFHCLAADGIVDLHLTGDSQCFPFYTYDEDGSNRRENITDWSLNEFNSKLKTHNSKLPAATKWDIFYYVYGVLHHPEYRTKYAANLRRELPRVPVSADFFEISRIGQQLADLHVKYEDQKPYELEQVWRESAGLNLRVEKMKLSKSKSSIIYNADLTLNGIPETAFEYKLGNRSALEWIIDQYQVSTDKRSGITNDPNREDEPEYILELLQKVIAVSLETVKLVGELSKLKLAAD